MGCHLKALVVGIGLIGKSFFTKKENKSKKSNKKSFVFTNQSIALNVATGKTGISSIVLLKKLFLRYR